MQVRYTSVIYPDKRDEAWYGSRFAEWLHHRHFLASGRLLDVGCGKGNYLAGFRSLGFDCVGLDRDRGAVEGCRARGLDAVRFDVDAGNLPFADGTFDYVFCKSVIEHLSSRAGQARFLRELARVCRPGGRIFLHTHDWASGFREFYDDPTHTFPFTQKALANLCAMLGFRVLLVRRHRHVPGSWRLSWRAFDVSLPLPNLEFSVVLENARPAAREGDPIGHGPPAPCPRRGGGR